MLALKIYDSINSIPDCIFDTLLKRFVNNDTMLDVILNFKYYDVNRWYNIDLLDYGFAKNGIFFDRFIEIDEHKENESENYNFIMSHGKDRNSSQITASLARRGQSLDQTSFSHGESIYSLSKPAFRGRSGSKGGTSEHIPIIPITSSTITATPTQNSNIKNCISAYSGTTPARTCHFSPNSRSTTGRTNTINKNSIPNRRNTTIRGNDNHNENDNTDTQAAMTNYGDILGIEHCNFQGHYDFEYKKNLVRSGSNNKQSGNSGLVGFEMFCRTINDTFYECVVSLVQNLQWKSEEELIRMKLFQNSLALVSLCNITILDWIKEESKESYDDGEYDNNETEWNLINECDVIIDTNKALIYCFSKCYEMHDLISQINFLNLILIIFGLDDLLPADADIDQININDSGLNTARSDNEEEENDMVMLDNTGSNHHNNRIRSGNLSVMDAKHTGGLGLGTI